MKHFSRPQWAPQSSAESQADSQSEPVLTGQDFYVDNWRVAPALNQISHRQQSLERHLEPRLMKLLCLLAARAGEVVARDELVAELWPRVIVNENSLTRAVSELRKMLQTEDFPARDKLRTIPKRGYRLTATVSAANDAAQHAAGPHSGATALPLATTLMQAWPALWSRPSGRRTAAMALSLSLTLSLTLSLSLALSLGLGDASDNNLPHSQAIPIADQQSTRPASNLPLRDEVVMDVPAPLAGQVKLSASWADERLGDAVQNPVMAADGDRFAYLEQDLSGSTIYLGQLSSEQSPLPIYHSPAPLSRLTWSPLGNALLFTRDSKLQTATAFEAPGQQPALYSLNLETLQVHRLIEEDDSRQSHEPPASNLTFARAKIPLSPARQRPPDDPWGLPV